MATPKTVPTRSQHQTQVKQPDIQALFQEMGDWYLAFRRATAGYLRLAGALNPNSGVGLPILEIKASADGHSAETVMIDLKNINPVELPNVVIPLARHLQGAVLEAAAEIDIRVKEIGAIFEAMRQTGESPP